MAALERKNIEDLTAGELAAYEHAIEKLVASGDYQTHADFHNVFSDDPPLGCEHANDLFFPWHRFHLLNFERSLQLSDPDHPTLSTKNVTIPYWNWGLKPRTGKRYPEAFERAGTVLSSTERKTAATNPFYPADELKKHIVTNPDWNVFAGGRKGANEFKGVIESKAHDGMHGSYIGGAMADPTRAAEDPIYWSFHAYIDRLWEQWRQIHGGTPTCATCVMRGFPTKPAAGDVERTENELTLENGVKTLGYFYNFTAEELHMPADPIVDGISAAVLAGMPTGTQEETLHDLPRIDDVSFDMPAILDAPARAMLWLREVVRPTLYSCNLHVYLHPAGTSHTDKPHFHIGEYSFWKAHHVLPGQTCGTVISVTDALQPYAGSGDRHVLTLIEEVLPDSDHRGGHGGHHGGHHPPPTKLQFEGVVLQLNGTGIPDIPLGHVPAHG